MRLHRKAIFFQSPLFSRAIDQMQVNHMLYLATLRTARGHPQPCLDLSVHQITTLVAESQPCLDRAVVDK